MMRPVCLFLAGLFLLAIPVLAEPDRNSVSSPISLSNAAAQLEALRVEFLRSRARAGLLKETRAPVSEYFRLVSDLETLEQKILDLETLLAAVGESQQVLLPEFAIQGFMDRPGGDPITGYVSNGDILAFSAEVIHPDTGGDPLASELIWQLYREDGSPVEGVAKKEQAYEAGIQKTYTFRFRLDSMAPGDYQVGLTHTLLAAPDNRAQALLPVRIFDAMVPGRILVTDRPGGTAHLPFVTNDKLPHIYAAYRLSEGIEFVDAAITVIDAETGQVVARAADRRPPEKQQFGIRLEKEGLKPVQRFRVTTELTAPDGRTRTMEERFSRGYYRLGMTLPATLEPGKPAPFSIRPPQGFEAPFTVDLTPSTGLVLHHEAGGLSGKVTGIASSLDLHTGLGVTVTDSSGKTAKDYFRVRVMARTDPPEKTGKQTPAAKGPERSSAQYQAAFAKCREDCIWWYRYLRNLPKPAHAQPNGPYDDSFCRSPEGIMKSNMGVSSCEAFKKLMAP